MEKMEESDDKDLVENGKFHKSIKGLIINFAHIFIKKIIISRWKKWRKVTISA